MGLPQRLKEDPTIFREALATDWRDLQLNEGVLLQYVDGILTARRTKEALRPKYCKGKAQISQPTLRYLGFEVSKGQRNVLPDGREALVMVTVATTRRHSWGFLGIAGFCRIWIPNFELWDNMRLLKEMTISH